MIVAGEVVASITPKHRSGRRCPTLSAPTEPVHTGLRLERDPEPVRLECGRRIADSFTWRPEAASD
jgi:hypothetical protein